MKSYASLRCRAKACPVTSMVFLSTPNLLYRSSAVFCFGSIPCQLLGSSKLKSLMYIISFLNLLFSKMPIKSKIHKIHTFYACTDILYITKVYILSRKKTCLHYIFGNFVLILHRLIRNWTNSLSRERKKETNITLYIIWHIYQE